jgi:hypothetical protein
MKLRVLNLVTLLSLLLWVATVACWTWSYRQYWAVSAYSVGGPRQRPVRHLIHVSSSLGSLSLCYEYENAVNELLSPSDRSKWSAGWIIAGESFEPPPPLLFPGNGTQGQFGFRQCFKYWAEPMQTRREHLLILPYWFLLLLFAVPWMSRLACRFRHPGRRGVCRTCGYDLRASSERCPECGVAILLDSAKRVQVHA